MSAPWLRSTLVLCAFIALIFAPRPFARDVDQAKDSAGAKPPVVLTNQEDRQRMLDQLKISGIPPSPAPYLAATYDEKTANPYPNLPDPLIMNDATKVTTPGQWKKRRAEIVELFDRDVYGRRPKVMPKVTWEVVSTTTGTTDSGFGAAGASNSPTGSAVVTKQLVGRVDNSAYPLINVNLIASLSTPANVHGPVPVVMILGAVAPPPGVPAQPNPCLPPGAPARGTAPIPPAGARAAGAGGAAGGPPATAEPSAQEQIVRRGWGYATISTASIQADCGAGLTVGIIGLVNKGQPRKLDDWGVLSAWGWGMSKLLDYLETDKAVDAKKVAVQGHSRNGKAALVAMAYDERFLTGFISSSGESGAKLHRRKYGELIENIAALNEYHWMAGNFLKYSGRWDQLPVDSHELVALCAPRPVFLSAGKGPDENPDGTVKMLDPNSPGVNLSRGPVEQQAANINDAWVDAKGTFLAGVGAGPVYRLLGKKDLGTTEFPKIETALIGGDIGFRQHAAGHTPGPNWPVFLEFAAKYFDAPAVAPKTMAKTR